MFDEACNMYLQAMQDRALLVLGSTGLLVSAYALWLTHKVKQADARRGQASKGGADPPSK
jgi:hypothetical protein